MSACIVLTTDGRGFVLDSEGVVVAELRAVPLVGPPSELSASYHSALNALNALSDRILDGSPSESDTIGQPAHPFMEGVMAAKNGEANGNSKLTPKQVQQIGDNVRLGFSQRAVAAHFGLSQATVSDIVAGRMWGHLPDEPASVLRRVDFALVDPVMRHNRGRFGGPGGVVDLYPEQPADAADSDDAIKPPPRAA